jgi:TPR repeat protein
MADTKQVLENIKNEVSKATQSLQKKHPGADLAQAKRLLSETAEAIRSNQFDKAIILAQRAQLAADPTTEYLLVLSYINQRNVVLGIWDVQFP